MIEKVISGGQIGADIAGLRAATSLKIPTGGWMPKKFQTLLGPMPELELTHGLRALASPSYADRTYYNVKKSDGTLQLAYNFNSPGERCTIKAIDRLQKPAYVVPLLQGESEWFTVIDPLHTANWIAMENIKILNVAGNASTAIEGFVEQFLIEVFKHDKSGAVPMWMRSEQ